MYPSPLKSAFAWIVVLSAAYCPAQSKDAMDAAAQPASEATVIPLAPAQRGKAVPLSLHQAVQLALKENLSILIARLVMLQRQKDQTASLSSLLPQAVFASNAGVNRFNEQSFFGNSQPVRVGSYQTINIGGAFSQELLNLPLIRRYQVARRERPHRRRPKQSHERADCLCRGVTIPVRSAGSRNL